MGIIKDLTGQKFGHLTVLYDTGIRKNRQVVWECECDCEAHTRRQVVGQALRSGHTTSCGCSRKGKNIINLIGQHFGQLTVLKQDSINQDRKAVWLCKCDCGETRLVEGTLLRAGKVTCCYSCGVKKMGSASMHDLTGQKFGMLTVLEPTEERDNAGRIIWKCKCDCGNICFIPSNSLVTNNTQSCGCKHKSIGENIISKLLQDNNIPFIRQYTFSDCRSPKDSLLLFDFAIFKDNKLLQIIEFDGVQHYNPINFFGGEEAFNYLQQCDNIKNNYCKQNNIPLVRISYKDKNNIDLKLLRLDKYYV
jgi:hypothetical protein